MCILYVSYTHTHTRCAWHIYRVQTSIYLSLYRLLWFESWLSVSSRCIISKNTRRHTHKSTLTITKINDSLSLCILILEAVSISVKLHNISECLNNRPIKSDSFRIWLLLLLLLRVETEKKRLAFYVSKCMWIFIETHTNTKTKMPEKKQ